MSMFSKPKAAKSPAVPEVPVKKEAPSPEGKDTAPPRPDPPPAEAPEARGVYCPFARRRSVHH